MWHSSVISYVTLFSRASEIDELIDSAFGLQQASEHAHMYHGYTPPTKENLTSEHLFDTSQLQSVEDPLPISLDWREKGYVTEVKTQVKAVHLENG